MLVISAVFGRNPEVAFASEPCVNGFTKQRLVNFERVWTKAQDVACRLQGGKPEKAKERTLIALVSRQTPCPNRFPRLYAASPRDSRADSLLKRRV